MFRKKLDNILSGFTKIQKELDAYADQTLEDLGVNEIKIAQLEEKRGDMKLGIEKANTVSANLRNLLGE